MKKKLLLLSVSIFLLAIPVAYKTIFTVPYSPELFSAEGHQNKPPFQCNQVVTVKSIDNDGRLDLLVWNLYKQNKASWQQALGDLSAERQLLLLQEASMTDELKQWVTDEVWISNQVHAFEVFNTSAGVLNLSKSQPYIACAYTQMEPWLRLPKSALYARYLLSNGQQLAVINIHAVNFTFGVADYQQQIAQLTEAVAAHQGPMIVAGDFNSWSQARVEVMMGELEKLELIEVSFEPDNRTQFITGLALDHIFYRGLKLNNAKAPMTDASDHNPLLVSFSLPLW